MIETQKLAYFYLIEIGQFLRFDHGGKDCKIRVG